MKKQKFSAWLAIKKYGLVLSSLCFSQLTFANSLPTTEQSIGERLVTNIKVMVSNINYNAYKLGASYFDAANGIYIADCSSFVDYMLRKTYPEAYSRLVTNSGTGKPTSLSYYQFFTTLNRSSARYWNPVSRVDQLRPGDILVFRPTQPSAEELPGHVMVVMSKPQKSVNHFVIRVADSSPFRHSRDTRTQHVSGIGIGSMVLKANPATGQPYAYAWQVGTNWYKTVRIAMGRPIAL